MRNYICKVFIITLLLFSCVSYTYAQGLSGWFNLISNTSDTYENGNKTTETDMVNKNLYLKLDKSITPMLSYQLNMRVNVLDADTTDGNGNVTTTDLRRIEPALELSLHNPMYDVSLGYRRQEEWSAAKLKDENRETSEFYYSRFNVYPRALPSLSLHIDRHNNFDYLQESEIDRESNSYSVSSAYELPSRDLRFRYNINVTHNEDETPLSTTLKTINDNFNGNYNFGYSGKLWDRKATYVLGYQGNYSENKNRQFVAQTGTFVNERVPLGGLYAQGSAGSEDVDVLTYNAAVVEDYYVSTGFDIGNDNVPANRFHNLGIFVSAQNFVDRLFIYVNRDVSGDTILTNLDNWKIYKSDFNQAGTWQEIVLLNKVIAVTPVDLINNIYRYEIIFADSHQASFYKAVNMETANIANVSVTKIEAWGTDNITQLENTNTSTAFTQGLNLVANIRLRPGLAFALNYSMDRADQNPVSLGSSIWGILQNMYTDSVSGDKEDFTSNISRNYGITTSWQAHRLLTTNLRLQRNENFDNRDETDNYSNTYRLSFNSVPIPTLDTTFSVVKSERYSFNIKEADNNSALLSVGTMLYPDVNMVNDLAYTNSKSFVNDTKSESYSLNGSLDALITDKVSGILNYAYSRTVSAGSSSVSKEALTTVNYQPGRLINVSGNFNVLDSEGNTTISEGLLFDWLFLPAVRLNVSYYHADAEPGPVISDTFSGYGVWYLTKFADMRFSYAYSRIKENIKTENHSFNTNLNCRF